VPRSAHCLCQPSPLGHDVASATMCGVCSLPTVSRSRVAPVTMTVVGLVLLVPVLAGCGSSGTPTASELFGMNPVISQTRYDGGDWLAAGLVCPGSSSSSEYGLPRPGPRRRFACKRAVAGQAPGEVPNVPPDAL